MTLSTDVLIIEDETVIAMDLEDMVETMGHRVVGVARSATEAVSLFQLYLPKLILADIHLADGSSGIDAVNTIQTAMNVPVIFITAFPERLIGFKRHETVSLLTKPFKFEDLESTVKMLLDPPLAP